MVRNNKWRQWKGNWQACALGQKEESRRDNRKPMCGCQSLTSISLSSHFSLEITFMPPIFFSVFHPVPWSFYQPVLDVGLVRVHGEIFLCLQWWVEKCDPGTPQQYSQWISYPLRTLCIDQLWWPVSESLSTTNNPIVMGVPNNQPTNFGTAQCTKCWERGRHCTQVVRIAILLLSTAWFELPSYDQGYALHWRVPSMAFQRGVREKSIIVLVEHATNTSNDINAQKWPLFSAMKQDIHQGRK